MNCSYRVFVYTAPCTITSIYLPVLYKIVIHSLCVHSTKACFFFAVVILCLNGKMKLIEV